MVKDYSNYFDILSNDFPDVDPSDIRLALSEGCRNMSKFLRLKNGFEMIDKTHKIGFKTVENPVDSYNPVIEGINTRICTAEKIAIMSDICSVRDTGETYAIINIGAYRGVMYGNLKTAEIRTTSQKEVAALSKKSKDIILELFDYDIRRRNKRKVCREKISSDEFPEHRIVMGEGLLSFDVFGTSSSKKPIKFDNIYKLKHSNGNKK